MPRARVKSSVIAAISYDDSGRRLEVEFHNGRLYAYFGVPRTAYEALLTADSVGKYFNEEIKPNYRSRLLRGSDF